MLASLRPFGHDPAPMHDRPDIKAHAPRRGRQRAAAPPAETTQLTAGTDHGLGPAAVVSVEASLGHTFSDPSLLASALTHRSFANDHQQLGVTDYQRLEFLGDAVVGCVVADLLYRQDPRAREGVLTLRRAAMVKEERLAEAARSLGLQPLIRVGQGDEAREFPERDSVLADVFEAVVAAIWLDAGPTRLDRVESLLARVFAPDLASKSPPRMLKPPKSRLQELAQARWKLTPRYALVADGDSTETTVELTIGDQLSLRATGTSRKTAENRAAEIALDQILGDVHA